MGNEVKKIDTVVLREEFKVLTLAKLEEKYTEYGLADLWKNGTNKAIAIDTLINTLAKQNTVVEAVAPNGEETEKVLKGEVESVEVETPEDVDPGEYEVDQDTLDEYPFLVEQGFNIGDILVVEEGKPWSKKQVEEELKIKPGDPAFGTEGIVSTKTIEEADAEIKNDNANLDINGDVASQNGIDSKEINGVSRETINEELAGLNGGAVETESQDTEIDEEVDLLDGNEVVKEYVPVVIDESKFTKEEILENIELCQANLKDALPTTRIILLRKLEALEVALGKK